MSTASFNSVLVGGPELGRFDYSPSHSSPSSSRSLSLSGPTPTPSRPLSLFDSQAPTRVGSPAPSIKDKAEKGVEDEEKGEAAAVEEEYEGGLRAWAAVMGSTLALCCTFGVSNSFGVFLTYYSEVCLSFPSLHYSVSDFPLSLSRFFAHTAPPPHLLHLRPLNDRLLPPLHYLLLRLLLRNPLRPRLVPIPTLLWLDRLVGRVLCVEFRTGGELCGSFLLSEFGHGSASSPSSFLSSHYFPPCSSVVPC
jgi:hypothetical protein